MTTHFSSSNSHHERPRSRTALRYLYLITSRHCFAANFDFAAFIVVMHYWRLSLTTWQFKPSLSKPALVKQIRFQLSIFPREWVRPSLWRAYVKSCRITRGWGGAKVWWSITIRIEFPFLLSAAYLFQTPDSPTIHPAFISMSFKL